MKNQWIVKLHGGFFSFKGVESPMNSLNTIWCFCFNIIVRCKLDSIIQAYRSMMKIMVDKLT
jgi:hypothetical protein